MQPFGVAGFAMTPAAEADHVHASRPCGGDTVDAVLQYEAVAGCDAEFIGSVKEEIGSRLAPLDHEGAKHVWVEEP
jgi:hypothetical protein